MSIYCERFSAMIPTYARNQKEFAELIGVGADVVTKMKKNESMLMIHLPDIAKGIPDFDFRYLMVGDYLKKEQQTAAIAVLAKKILKICEKR